MRKNADITSFTYPRAYSVAGTLIIILMSLVWAMLLIIVIFDKNSDFFWAFILCSVGCLGFILFSLWLIRSHSAIITLTPTEIIHKNGSKTNAIRYERISVTHDAKTTRSLILRTANDKLVINKNISNYQQLWDILNTKLPEATKQAVNGNTLQVRCSGGTCFSCAVFLVISVAFIVLGWYAFVAGQISIAYVLVIIFVLLPFAIVLFFAILRSPWCYMFYADTIVEKTLAGQIEYPVSKITQFNCGQRFVKVNAKVGSYFAHFVELKFDGAEKTLVIDNKDTNYPIEELSDFLTKTYRLEGIKTIVTPECDAKNS